MSDTAWRKFSPTSVDMSGEVYGHLTVIARAPSDGAGRARWRCRCSCGTEVVRLRQVLLEGGANTSCGCKVADRCRALGLSWKGRKRKQREKPESAVGALDALTLDWGKR